MIRQSSPASRPNRLANRKASSFSKQSVAHAFRVMAPTLVALTFASAAHAQGTMDFSGAQTLMGTFKTFAIYAGAVILCSIRSGPVRLGQLRRELKHASKKVLTENLRELEEAGLVVRRDLGGSVRHVEYDFNETMRPQIQAMLDHLADFGHTFGGSQNKTANGVSK